jgi:hypothetical protein
MSNRRPLFTQNGIVNSKPLTFNNPNPVHRTIAGVCEVEVVDSNNVVSHNALTISKMGQTGYFSLSGESQSFVFQPTNSNGTGGNVLSISDGTATIDKTLVLRDGNNTTSFTQSGANLVIDGAMTFGSAQMSSIVSTNIASDFIGATGIFSSNIMATSITGGVIHAGSFYADGPINYTTQLATKQYVDDAVIIASSTVSADSVVANTIGATGLITAQAGILIRNPTVDNLTSMRIVTSSSDNKCYIQGSTTVGVTGSPADVVFSDAYSTNPHATINSSGIIVPPGKSILTPLLRASDITGQTIYANTISAATSIQTLAINTRNITAVISISTPLMRANTMNNTESFEQLLPTQTVQFGYQNNINMTGNSYFGYQAGQTGFAQYAVAVGYQAGQRMQETGAIAIGYQAGQIGQKTGAIAVGFQAGQSNQSRFAIAIGDNAGKFNQKESTIAIGEYAGHTNQATSAIAIGQFAGQTNQQNNAIAIGEDAGRNNQGANAIAIGESAGRNNQGANSIAIGSSITCTVANTVVLNPTNNPFTATTVSSFYSTSLRRDGGVTGGVMLYDSNTKEIANNPNLYYTTNGLMATTAVNVATGASFTSGEINAVKRIRMNSTDWRDRAIQNTHYQLWDKGDSAGGNQKGQLYADMSDCILSLGKGMNFSVNISDSGDCLGVSSTGISTKAITSTNGITISPGSDVSGGLLIGIGTNTSGNSLYQYQTGSSSIIRNNNNSGIISFWVGTGNPFIIEKDVIKAISGITGTAFSGSSLFIRNNTVGSSLNLFSDGASRANYLDISGSFHIRDLTIPTNARNPIVFVPVATSGQNNRIVRTGDHLIFAAGASEAATKALTLTAWSDTTTGVRIANNSVVVGAGGTAGNDPTTRLTIDGSDNTITAAGLIKANSEITGNQITGNGLTLIAPGKSRLGLFSDRSNSIGNYLDVSGNFHIRDNSSGNANLTYLQTSRTGIKAEDTNPTLLITSSGISTKAITSTNGITISPGTDLSGGLLIGTGTNIGTSNSLYQYQDGTYSVIRNNNTNGIISFWMGGSNNPFLMDKYGIGTNGRMSISTTSLGATPSLSISETAGNHKLMFFPTNDNYAFNPLVTLGDQSIVAASTQANTDALTLTTHSSTATGVRILSNSVVLGAGGTAQSVLATRLTIDGTNSTAVLTVGNNTILTGQTNALSVATDASFTSGEINAVKRIRMNSTDWRDRAIQNTHYQLWDKGDSAGGNQKGQLYADMSDCILSLDKGMNFSVNISDSGDCLGVSSTGISTKAITCANLQITTAGNTIALGIYGTTSSGPNIGIGSALMTQANTSSSNNIAIGNKPLQSLTSGTNNIAIGMNALNATTTGNHNVSVGHNALSTSTGDGNVCIGATSGGFTSGANNTCVGAGATANNNLSYATAIGAGANCAHNNTIQLGRTTDTARCNLIISTFQGSLSGNVTGNLTGIASQSTNINVTNITSDTSATQYLVFASASGNNVPLKIHSRETSLTYSATTGTVTAIEFNSVSDYRIKTNVQPITSNKYQVDALNPVSYYNTLSNKTDLGFIAHEVQEHFPMLVSGVKDGPSNQSINYSGLIPVLVSEIKELKMQMQQMKQELQEIRKNTV